MFQPKPVFTSRYGVSPLATTSSGTRRNTDVAHPQRPPLRLAAGAAGGTGAWPTMSSDREHLPRHPAHVERLPRRRARSNTTARPASTGTRHEADVHPPRGPLVAEQQPGPHRAHPLGHPHAEGRRQEEHEEGGEHRREVEELVGPVERQHGVEGRGPPPPRGAACGGTPAARGSPARSRRSATITAHSSPAAPPSCSADEPDGVGGLAEVEGGAAHRPVEERRSSAWRRTAKK